jgi:hypothetical protein
MEKNQTSNPIDSDECPQPEQDHNVVVGKLPDEYAVRLKSYEEKIRRYERG